MKILRAIRYGLFMLVGILAMINQIAGLVISLILIGFLCHRPLLFCEIVVVLLAIDFWRHKWLTKQGVGIPMIGQYVNREKAKELEERLDDYENVNK